MGILLRKDTCINGRTPKWGFFPSSIALFKKGKCPVVEKMSFFSEKDIENAQLATLPKTISFPPIFFFQATCQSTAGCQYFEYEAVEAGLGRCMLYDSDAIDNLFSKNYVSTTT